MNSTHPVCGRQQGTGIGERPWSTPDPRRHGGSGLRPVIPPSHDDGMSPEERYAALGNELLGDQPIEPGKGFGASALKVNGKIFAMLVKEQLVVKLPRQRVHTLVAADTGGRFDPGHGRLMKEWLTIDPAAEPEWLPLAREAWRSSPPEAASWRRAARSAGGCRQGRGRNSRARRRAGRSAPGPPRHPRRGAARTWRCSRRSWRRASRRRDVERLRGLPVHTVASPAQVSKVLRRHPSSIARSYDNGLDPTTEQAAPDGRGRAGAGAVRARARLCGLRRAERLGTARL